VTERSPSPPQADRPLDPTTASGVAKIGAGGLFFFAASLFAGGILSAYGLVSLVAKAIIAEIGLSRLGVAWADDPEEAAPSSTKNVLRGIGMGLAASVLAALAAFVLGRAHFEPGGLVLATLGTGLVSAGATAVAHELFFRGLVLKLTSRIASTALRVVACGAAEAAFAFGQPGATVLEAAVLGTLGGITACLWLRDRAAYTAIGAHAGWLFGTRAVFRGGLFELAGSASFMGGLGAGAFSGGASWLVLACALVAAAASLRASRAAARA
jgi:hypothetical protein